MSRRNSPTKDIMVQPADLRYIPMDAILQGLTVQLKNAARAGARFLRVPYILRQDVLQELIVRGFNPNSLLAEGYTEIYWGDQP